MIFAHSFFGVFTTYAVLKILPYKFSRFQQKVLWFVGITSSILPDADIIYYLWCPLCSHREIFTHGVPIYFLISLFIFAVGLFVHRRKFFTVMAVVFLLGIVGHLILDMGTGGLVFFAPFSYRKYGLSLDSVGSKSEWWSVYISSLWFYLEIAISFLYLFLAASLKEPVVKFLPLVYFSFSLISAWLIF